MENQKNLFYSKKCDGARGGHTVAELKDICRSLNLKVSGTKNELCDRIKEYFEKNMSISKQENILVQRKNSLPKQENIPVQRKNSLPKQEISVKITASLEDMINSVNEEYQFDDKAQKAMTKFLTKFIIWSSSFGSKENIKNMFKTIFEDDYKYLTQEGEKNEKYKNLPPVVANDLGLFISGMIYFILESSKIDHEPQIINVDKSGNALDIITVPISKLKQNIQEDPVLSILSDQLKKINIPEENTNNLSQKLETLNINQPESFQILESFQMPEKVQIPKIEKRKTTRKSKKEKEQEIVKVEQTGVSPEIRKKNVEFLVKVFSANTSLSPEDIKGFVEKIESGIYDRSKNDSGYRDRALFIINNINPRNKSVGNKTLLSDILIGTIEPYYLGYSATAEELMPERNEKIAPFANYKQLTPEEIEALPDAPIACFKCRSKKLTYTSKQLRSSDEPESKFFYCYNCENRWKTNN